MLTLAPLPTWGTLFRSVCSRTPDHEAVAAPWRRAGDRSFLLSRSTWSFLALAAARRAMSNTTQCVWIPDYMCNCALAPLRAEGVRLVFYPLTESRDPDYAAFRRLRGDAPPDLFVLVHYFGKPAESGPAVALCRDTGAWLVEDAAHSLHPTPGIGECGDFVLYSPHKHLGAPDGAVLVMRSDGPAVSANRAVIERSVVAAHRRLTTGGRIGAAPYVWVAKRVLQKMGVRSRTSSLDPWADPGTVPVPSARPSGLGLRLLSRAGPSLAFEAHARQVRQEVWGVLVGDGGLAPAAHRTVGVTPYLAEFTFGCESAARTFYADVSRRMPVTTWPDLPPEVLADPVQHASAIARHRSSVFVPVHSSLSLRQMARALGYRGSSQGEDPPLHIRWMSGSPEDTDSWNSWMRAADDSNLLQSWSYGQAKHDAEGWRVRRGVLVRADHPVAFAQVLEKRFAGFAVRRINRGPLFIAARQNGETSAALRALRELGRWRRGAILLLGPELPSDGHTALDLALAGFRERRHTPWGSARIDLTPPLDEIRASLDRKWRNMLTAAEKLNLQVQHGCDEELWKWMVASHGEHMARRHFSGISIGILESLRKHADSVTNLQIFRAVRNGVPIAGTCVARHALEATYLVGWTTEDGRQARATYLLLWHALSILKQSGYRRFDLGGIDEIGTPGVARFKLGMNGVRYTLAGEFMHV